MNCFLMILQPIVNKQFEIEDEGFGDNSDDKSDSGGSKPPTPPPESATMVPGRFIISIQIENKEKYEGAFSDPCK